MRRSVSALSVHGLPYARSRSISMCGVWNFLPGRFVWIVMLELVELRVSEFVMDFIVTSGGVGCCGSVIPRQRQVCWFLCIAHFFPDREGA